MKIQSLILASLLTAVSFTAFAEGSGLNSEDLKRKPVDKIIAKEPARPSLGNTSQNQKLEIANKPQAAASQSSSQKENLNKAAYLKNIMKPGKSGLGGESGSQSSGGNSGQGCINCNNP